MPNEPLSPPPSDSSQWRPEPPRRVEEDDDEKPQGQSAFREAAESQAEAKDERQKKDTLEHANRRLMKKQAIELGNKQYNQGLQSEIQEAKDTDRYLHHRKRKQDRTELKREQVRDDLEPPNPGSHAV